MKTATSLSRASRFVHRTLLTITVIATAMLTGCNIRENTLLPPNLDPKLYTESKVIKVYLDHLIRSENDDSYLYIKKESITDNALWYADTIRFSKVTSLTQRDSLAFPEANTPLTNTYQISVIRNGNEVILDSIPEFGTIFTDLSASDQLNRAHLVKHSYQLFAEPISIYPYGNSRCFFDINGSGEFEPQVPNETKLLNIEDSGKDVEALIFDTDIRISIWFPAAYLSSVQQLDLGIEDSPNPNEISLIQTLYPGFAQNTKVVSLQTRNPAVDNDSPPILHYRLPETRYFEQQWLRVGQTDIQGWSSGTDSWLIDDGTLISFIKQSGSYCLITPMAEQQILNIPLDGTYDKLFLQDLWFDLRDIAIPNTSLRVDLAPSVTSVINDYFTGSPFTLASPYQAFRIEFMQSGTVIETLPNDAWIEYGFRDRHSASVQARLFRVYRDAANDHLDYKIRGTEYDANRYTLSSGFVYSGMNSSGMYIYGNATEPTSATTIPIYKANAVFQYSKGFISWQDSNISSGSLSLEHNAPIPETHPWLNGQPYTLSSSNSILKITASRGTRNRNILPANLFLSYTHPSGTSSVINFQPDPSYPRFIRYDLSNILEHNTFRYANGRLEISPVYPGYLISGQSLDAPSILNLRLFSRMTFDDHAWELHLDSPLPLIGERIMQVRREDSLPDTYGILANQYQLSPFGDAWSFYIDQADEFYANHLPFIRIQQSVNTLNQLFSETQGEYYRIYPYTHSGTSNPWNFSISEGHITFFLAYNASYRAMNDNAPHLAVNTIVSTNARDHIVSLYQAQMNIPASLIPGSLPLTTRINLIRLPNFTAPITPLNAYRVEMRNAVGIMLQPDFDLLPNDAELPYIYVPVPNYIPGTNYRLFFKDMNNAVTEYTRVTDWSNEPLFEFIMIGNCAVCLVTNPGVFYITN